MKKFLCAMLLAAVAQGCGEQNKRVDVQAPPGPRGPSGPKGQDGKPGEPGTPGTPSQGGSCEVADLGSSVTITCNGKTVSIPKNGGANELVICVWTSQCTTQTVTARIEDINAQKYQILHLGQCFGVAPSKNNDPSLPGC